MKSKPCVAICISVFFLGVLVGTYHHLFGFFIPKASESIMASILGSLIGAAVSVIGWFAVFRANNHIQNRKMKYDISNTARIEIIKGIRDYQNWLSKVNQAIAIRNELPLSPNETVVVLGGLNSLHYENIKSLYDNKPEEWNQRLEDYQIVFPETAKIRVQLQDRAIDIESALYGIWDSLSLPIAEVVSRCEVLSQVLLDQACLFEDLRIHFQNACLSTIYGNKIKNREPQVGSPKVIEGNKGLLEILHNTNPISSEGKERKKFKEEHGKKFGIEY